MNIRGRFASGDGLAYIPPMAIFPRPVSPKSALGDLWGYFREQRPHKWPALGVSMAITWVIVWTFITDANTNTMPTRNKIFYVQSWNADRSDAAIILQQKMDLARREVLLQKRQKDMQGVADLFGIDWRQEEARNSARRKEALAAINAQLDSRLAKAKQAEGAPQP
ncbi:hypothetical protein WG908_04675 [Sphingobium sp. AN641]|uniref:hypothetical protein n=1 Tax=Sphingobium sp. AN641 TaxID=3133443 RepID=UPI0030BC4D11